MSAQPTVSRSPWQAAYPEPVSSPPSASGEDLLKRIKSGETAGKDFLLVDLRRTDHEGGTIAGSINLPAQSLYPTIPTLYNLVKAAGIRRVFWYCGSSKGRGTRAAAWFADYVARQSDSATESIVLQGGIAGWVSGGHMFTEAMLEYDEAKWTNVSDKS